MKRIIADKDLVKDCFQAIAYYVFIAGALKLVLPEFNEASISYKVGVFIIFLSLSVLATFYSMFHVSSSITKKFFPEFKTPIIDEDYEAPTVMGIFSRKDLLLWIAVGFPYYIIGSEIVGYGFK